MSEKLIRIENPPINRSDHTSFFLFSDELIDTFKEKLTHNLITPNSYPRVIELFAGDGPVAATLSELGWQDFTCADQAVSAHPVAPQNTVWIYLNLLEVIHRLKNNRDLNEISDLKHHFDIVTATFSFYNDYSRVNSNDLKLLYQFFGRENAFVFPSVYIIDPMHSQV